jgi:hypothetical protein
MPDRHILDGLVVLYEIYRKKMDGVIFKIDFEKTNDKVKWPFLQQVCKMKSFDPKWCEWVKNLCKEVVWE